MIRNEEQNNELNIYDGLKAGLPVLLGYFPIAMTFGLLAKGTGISFTEVLGFSFIVFAGASQFIAVSMIAFGASAMEIIITTLFLNFRHFLMSASLAPKLNLENPIAKLGISFFVTDESFSVASFSKGKINGKYMITMELMGYIGWGVGTGTGYIVGNFLPPVLQTSMNIALYAMFVALLMPEMKKSHKAIVLALTAAGINVFLRKVIMMQQGWSVVLSIIIGSLGGVMMFDLRTERNQRKEVADVE